MKIVVSAPSGLEGVTKREIFKLTGQDVKAINGKLTLDGDIETVAKLNLNLRTAGRVFLLIGSFKASTFDELFDGLSSLDFENYLDKNSKILVLSSLIESKLNSIQAVASVSKKAICSRLSSFYKTKLLENGFEHKIEINIRRDYVSVYLNTSGESLHKRGYRKSVGEAPIKENVASALLNLSNWNKSKVFVDPFCGSGTFCIELALMLKNCPPGLNRDFDFLHFEKFDTSFYSKMIEDAKNNMQKVDSVQIYGYDIEESQIKLCRSHAKKAGVSDMVIFEQKDMREFTSNKEFGVIVTNPPYGERLLKRNEIVSLYKSYGEMIKKLKNWSIFTITSVSDFERLVGKKADKKRKIHNGKLECVFYSNYPKKF